MDILDKPVISNEITEVVNSLKNKKAPGPDAIINETIKICVPSLTRVFVKVINHLFICEEFPKTWTEGFISVLYKKGDMLNPGFPAVREFGKRPGNTKKCFPALEKSRNLINLPKTRKKSVNFIPGHGIFARVHTFRTS